MILLLQIIKALSIRSFIEHINMFRLSHSADKVNVADATDIFSQNSATESF